MIGFTCSLCLRPLGLKFNFKPCKVLGIKTAIFIKTNNYPVFTCQVYANTIKRFSYNTTCKNLPISAISEEERDISNNFKMNLMNPKNRSLRLSIEFQDQILKSKLEEFLSKIDEITADEWDLLKKSVLEVLGNINEENIEAMIMYKCTEMRSLSLGKAYFKYLCQGGRKINRATYGNYLLLFFVCSSSCTKEELTEINEIYKTLLSVHPVIDYSTAEKAVFALSVTSNWREYENLFKIIRSFYQPTRSVYSIVIRTAFKNNDFDLGWKLMEEMKIEGVNVPDEVFIEWLGCDKHGYKENLDPVIKTLEFLKESNSKPSLELCEVIRKKFEDANKKSGSFTSILRTGECRNCRASLELAKVSQEDFDQLRRLFLDPVLIGKDIFQKTKPEEFNQFLDFIQKSSYNIVLDGLNIALRVHKQKRSSHIFASQLKSVVRHFNTLNKTVFVFGRKHMMKWPLREMQYIYDNAHVFFADDLSQDDPFLLYAALYSGLGTCFVSRDLMRTHKFLLANPKVQSTFQKWQSQHQYFVKHIEPDGKVHLTEPVRYMQSIQCNARGDWHIPYTDKEADVRKLEPSLNHPHWMCISSKTNDAVQKLWSKGHSSKPRRLDKPKCEKISYKVSFDD